VDGWLAVREPCGDPTRDPPDAVEAVSRLAELGAYGVSFHEDDLVPFGSNDGEREGRIRRFPRRTGPTGLLVPMVTTNPFKHSMFKDGAFMSNNRKACRYALRKVMCNLDLAAELGAATYFFWGGAKAPRPIRRNMSGRLWIATGKRSTSSLNSSSSAGYAIRFAIELKPERTLRRSPPARRRERARVSCRRSGIRR
jgi:xylose isomerase